MKQKIVECIPNFSEGQRKEVVDAIASAIASVSDVFLLDRSSDADHNRSVITFAGSPLAVSVAAFAPIAKAAELIDMQQQQGQHPRIGATDVVPFVPLSGITMAECVEMARELGKRVGEELGIPVYLYEQAAARPDRVNLADVRRGEYEGLREAIKTDPDYAPDFGPQKLDKAGATAIGARGPLIAFNVYLTTDDVRIAKRIAKTIRYSSGGLPHVKALGLLVEGRAQVSMNLTDYTQTPIARVVEAIRHEADRYGVAIHASELIGLIPQSALVDAAQTYLQLDRFTPEQVLEHQLFSAIERQNRRSASAFLESLAAGTATPAGGSAVAYGGAMGASLVAMVARLTIDKKKYAHVSKRMAEIVAQTDDLRAQLERGVTRDARAYHEVMVAYRLTKGTTPEENAARAAAIERAMHRAAEVPLETLEQATEVLQLAAEVAETGNASAVADVAAGAALAQAAIRASVLNVGINAASVSDREAADRWLKRVDELESRAQEAEQRVNEAILERGGL